MDILTMIWMHFCDHVCIFQPSDAYLARIAIDKMLKILTIGKTYSYMHYQWHNCKTSTKSFWNYIILRNYPFAHSQSTLPSFAITKKMTSLFLVFKRFNVDPRKYFPQSCLDWCHCFNQIMQASIWGDSFNFKTLSLLKLTTMTIITTLISSRKRHKWWLFTQNLAI